MANEIRLRANNISGTITNNPLLIGGTTINSPGFVDLPTVTAANHLLLILDPLEIGGTAEIVMVTAHTAAASSVTVIRGAEGSVARQHAIATTWFHGPVVSDWTHIVTSATRPTTPYEGEFIYETDTNKLVGFGGTDWAPRDAGGQLGYAEITATQAGISTITDITGLTTTVTVGAGRRIRITGYVLMATSAGAPTYGTAYIFEGAAQLQLARIDTPLAETEVVAPMIVLTPSAGSHTYKLRADAQAVSVSVVGAAANPSFILVEDIGAA